MDDPACERGLGQDTFKGKHEGAMVGKVASIVAIAYHKAEALYTQHWNRNKTNSHDAVIDEPCFKVID